MNKRKSVFNGLKGGTAVARCTNYLHLPNIRDKKKKNLSSDSSLSSEVREEVRKRVFPLDRLFELVNSSIFVRSAWCVATWFDEKRIFGGENRFTFCWLSCRLCCLYLGDQSVSFFGLFHVRSYNVRLNPGWSWDDYTHSAIIIQAARRENALFPRSRVNSSRLRSR